MRALWPSRQNCSHNVSQKLERSRRFSEDNYQEDGARQGLSEQLSELHLAIASNDQSDATNKVIGAPIAFP